MLYFLEIFFIFPSLEFDYNYHERKLAYWRLNKAKSFGAIWV